MLLATLTANLQSSYAQIQSQIEALQEQQRLIQAQLQRVGSVESKMESAAALVAEAIAEIREVCPEELSDYRQVIDGLFGDAPIAQIQAGEDVSPEPQPQENPVSPTSDTIEATVETLLDKEETEEPTVEVSISHQASARSLHKQAAKPLQWLAVKRGIDYTGLKRHEIASALVGQVTTTELQEAIEQAQNVG
jgi:hypothetical protein